MRDNPCRLSGLKYSCKNLHVHFYPMLGLTLETLKSKVGVTDTQLDTEIGEKDIALISASFENADDYIEMLDLLPAEKTDVANKPYTQARVKCALLIWRNKNPVTATFRKLVDIALSLSKGVLAVQVCEYIKGKLPGVCMRVIHNMLAVVCMDRLCKQLVCYSFIVRT